MPNLALLFNSIGNARCRGATLLRWDQFFWMFFIAMLQILILALEAFPT